MAQTMAEHLIEKGKAQGIEQGIEQGKVQGIEQGKAQGIEQGKIQEKRDAILKVLQLRFHTIPESIADKISSIQSLPRLDSLLEQAVHCKDA